MAADDVSLTEIDELKFEEAFAEMELVLGRFDRGDVSLAEAVSLYERGVGLKLHCDKLLADAEARVEKVRLSAEGAIISSEPFVEEE